jgi:hypothetical protein
MLLVVGLNARILTKKSLLKTSLKLKLVILKKLLLITHYQPFLMNKCSNLQLTPMKICKEQLRINREQLNTKIDILDGFSFTLDIRKKSRQLIFMFNGRKKWHNKALLTQITT